MEEYLFEITKEEINSLPLSFFEGEIIIIQNPEETALLDEIQPGMTIGFDSEARPSFRKGEHYPISLVQISTEDKAFLVRVNKVGIPSQLIRILTSEKIIKIGLGLKAEIKELEKTGGRSCNGFVDLEPIAQKLKFRQRGVRALAAHFLKVRISKNAQKSNWERVEFTPSQITYAATDAWIVLRVYNAMKDLGLIDSNNHSA